MNTQISDKEATILNAVEKEVLAGLNLGFDLQVLEILEDPDADERQIEMLKTRISEEVLIRLFNIANSVHYGHLRKGKVDNFYQLVSRLGMSFTKTLILILSLFALVRSREAETVFARCFAVSVIAGKVLGRELGLREDDAKKVELGGLFCEIGKVVMILYKERYPREWDKMDPPDDFLDKFNSYFGEQMIEKFKLPDHLREMVATDHISLGEELLTLSGILHIARCAVDAGFKKSGKLVLHSPMPDMNSAMASNRGSFIYEQFKAIGLEKYIEIVRRTPSQKRNFNVRDV